MLNQTPPEQLEKAARPMLDIEGALKFLALDKALINNDGYWIRMSDYSIYQEVNGRFHVIPHDANETLQAMEGGFGEDAASVRRPADSVPPRRSARFRSGRQGPRVSVRLPAAKAAASAWIWIPWQDWTTPTNR